MALATVSMVTLDDATKDCYSCDGLGGRNSCELVYVEFRILFARRAKCLMYCESYLAGWIGREGRSVLGAAMTMAFDKKIQISNHGNDGPLRQAIR